jgi:hypothetical protein
MKPDSTQCLTPEQIEELLYSTVTSEGQMPPNEHLLICPRCREELVSLPVCAPTLPA